MQTFEGGSIEYEFGILAEPEVHPGVSFLLLRPSLPSQSFVIMVGVLNERIDNVLTYLLAGVHKDIGFRTLANEGRSSVAFRPRKNGILTHCDDAWLGPMAPSVQSAVGQRVLPNQSGD